MTVNEPPVIATLECHRNADAVYTLRVHALGASFGGPYEWACTAVVRGKVARLHGAICAPNPTQWRAIAEVMRAHSVEFVSWERRTARGVRDVRIKL